MSKLNACDDENGMCKACGHPFDPHVVIAYDRNDLAKGGEMRCQVEGCVDLSDKEWNMKL